jgi:hypothetical protein
MTHIDGRDLAELRQLGTTTIRNIVLFMDNPFAYADKLEEAVDQIDALIELRNTLGLEGDGIQLSSSEVSHFSNPDNPNAELGSLLMKAGLAKLHQVLNDLGGFADE